MMLTRQTIKNFNAIWLRIMYMAEYQCARFAMCMNITVV